MKAVNYQGPFKVKVEDVPMPNIEHPDDVVVKITTSGELKGNVALFVTILE
jgi:threonine dehydrogenase-like Zn-dependent dehydrogenase